MFGMWQKLFSGTILDDSHANPYDLVASSWLLERERIRYAISLAPALSIEVDTNDKIELC